MVWRICTISTKDIHLFCRIVPTVFDDGRNGVSVILEDITERKISEAALFASEKRFQSLVEMLPQSIWECDDRGNVTFVNQRTYEMYGYDYEDVEKGMTIWQTIHPDDRERVLGDFIRASREEPSEFPAFHEFMSIRKDGSTFPLITYHVPIIHENKITGMRGIGIDISERKRAEEALRESEGKLNAMLQSISDPVSMMDKDLTIMWANEPAKRYFGKDIIGKKCYEAYHRRPDPCEPYPCITLKVFLDGKEHQHVTTVIDHQGEKRFFECSANVALRDNAGKPVAVLEISRDITDKKKAQDAIIESEEKYQTLVNRANDVICVVQDGIIKIFNPRLPEIWGGSGEEIMGKPFTDFVHPALLSELIDNYKRRISGESFPSIYETILMKKDGSKMFVELNAGVIEYKGRPANLVVARDISDRKKMEETLFETEQRLQNFISAIGDIVWETDAEARFVYVSPQVETILGRKPEELIGHTPFEFLHPDAVYMNKKKFQSAVENNEKSVIHVSQWTHKDGYDVLLESNAIPKYDRNGLFSGFIGIDRKRNNRVFL